MFSQDDSTLSRQKKDAESNWKAQVPLYFFFKTLNYDLVFLIVYLVSERKVKRCLINDLI